MDMEQCLIWGTEASVLSLPEIASWRVTSRRAGGVYQITEEALRVLAGQGSEGRARLTTWIVDQQKVSDLVPEVTQRVVLDMEMQPSLRPIQRRDRLLSYLAGVSETLGTQIVFFGAGDDWTDGALASSESLDAEECSFLAKQLAAGGYVDLSRNGYMAVSIEGYEYLESIERTGAKADQAFVAMWFDDTMRAAYEEGIHKGVEDAGYVPLRIDGKHHNNKIDDEIIAEIRRSRFVVVDFTQAEGNARGGVYYEAGFAHGLKTPVIFTCRADAIEYVHFDTRQYNHIVWETPEDLREKLAQRISAVIGDGPHRTVS